MGRHDSMWNHLGRIRIEANLQRHPATFPYMIFLHRWSFCIGDHFASVFVLSVAVIVRFAIESFCSTFSCLFCDWDCQCYNDHRSFFNFNMFNEYNRLFCQNVFFTLSAAHTFPCFLGKYRIHSKKNYPDKPSFSHISNELIQLFRYHCN